MKTRKVISAFLAGACAISALSFSAMAAGDKTIKAAGETSYKIAAAPVAAEINVSIPSAVAAVINPYGVEVTVKGETYGADGVTSPVYPVRNFTLSSGVKISGKATITVPDGITVKANDTGVDDSAKSIYVSVKGGVAAATLDWDADYSAEEDANVTLTDKLAFSADGTDGIIVSLPAAVGTVEGKTTTYTKYGYGEIQLGGKIGKGSEWGPKDKINLSLVLNITPAKVD